MKGRPRATGPLGDFDADTAGAGATGVPVAVAGWEMGVVVAERYAGAGHGVGDGCTGAEGWGRVDDRHRLASTWYPGWPGWASVQVTWLVAELNTPPPDADTKVAPGGKVSTRVGEVRLTLPVLV